MDGASVPQVVIAKQAGCGSSSGHLAVELDKYDHFKNSAGVLASLPPGAITVSDVHDGNAHHGPGNLPINRAQAWCAKKGSPNEVTIDLLEPRLVTACHSGAHDRGSTAPRAQPCNERNVHQHR